MQQIEIANRKLELRQGDIARQPDMEAIVNAANAELRIGGGVAGAIHRAAGPELERECRSLAPLEPGQAVITPAFNLPNRYVIHCLGPVYGRDEPSDRLLKQCYERALELADAQNISSVAFPAISTGAFSYPLQEAIPIALETLREHLPQTRYIEKVAMVLFSQADWQAHSDYMSEMELT